jgi:hypothetical protein
MVHHENIFEREVNLLKIRFTLCMDSSGHFVRTRLGHVFFYDWEYFRNHLIEILLPIRENSGGNLFGFITGWDSQVIKD